MSKHGTIRRYALIIEKIGRGFFPSFATVRAFLFNHGFEISTRTLQRDIEQMRFDFGIEIYYDRAKRGYGIREDEHYQTDSILRFIEIANTAEMLTESLRESSETLNYISFESRGQLRGIEHLKPLLFAVKNHRVIAFKHENFHTETTRHYTIEPYLLKEYQSRWYIVGKPITDEGIRTFGVDRMTELIISEEVFDAPQQPPAASLFEHTIGLDFGDQQPQEVVLALTPFQAKYVKALPLHPSQTVLVDNEHECHIQLSIVPNYEFKQRVLMLGPYVRVIRPAGLANAIRKSLEDTLRLYPNS